MPGSRPGYAVRYGPAHQALRKKLLATLTPGSACLQYFPMEGTICGQPMYASQRLHLGHDDNGGYIGLVHATCNNRASAQKKALLQGRTCTRCQAKYRNPPGRPSRLRLCPDCKAGNAPPQPVSQGRAW